MREKGSKWQVISFLVCLLSLVTSLATAGSAWAFKQEDLDKFREERECPRCDLSGADLSYLYLPGVNLAEADLTGANLTLSGLIQTNLSGANLSGAVMHQADLKQANLSGANLSGANLSQANLSQANLSQANLSQANLTGAVVHQADLNQANLSQANLNEANLNEANLYKAYMEKAELRGTQLNKAKLEMANLTGALMNHARLEEAKLERANLAGAVVVARLIRANLRGAYLRGANLQAILWRADLRGADLTGAKLRNSQLNGADLSGADLGGADLGEAYLGGATFPDGRVCQERSFGRCITTPPTPKTAQPTCPKTEGCQLPDDPPAGSGTLAMMYYIVYEGENVLCVTKTKDSSATVPGGILRYGRTYEYYILSISTADEVMDYQGPVSFTVGPKPDKEDDYGNPLAGQTLTDADGKTITLADAKLATLIAAGSGALSQASALAALQGGGGVVTDPNGNTVTMNTNDVHVARTNGGTGNPLVMAASDTNTIGFIKPLTASGYTVDNDGKMKTSPDLTLSSSNVTLPFGLFDFTVLLGALTNRAEVIIVPPTPFAAGTKWYKVAPDGTVKEYPNFVIDAKGNGILTLHDNDEWDANPAWGIIRDPGGPGAPILGDSGGGGSCFIATAAFGSYLHPYVKVLRSFRDTILLASSAGRAFVQWYYRVSPPIADVIARHNTMSAGVRVMLLPLIGAAWVWLHVGMLPTVLMFLLLGAVLFAATRVAWRRL